jgi:hypothetical protein
MRWTNIKTLSASDDRATSDSVPLLCFVQAFLNPVFYSGTLTMFTTHASSNFVFLQGLVQTDTVCFHIRSLLAGSTQSDPRVLRGSTWR